MLTFAPDKRHTARATQDMVFAMRAFLRPVQRQPLRLAAPAFQRPAARAFTSALPLRLKEDAARSGEEIDKIKKDQMEKQEKGEGHWHEELASSSESHIKADRQQPEDKDAHIEELQQQTAEKHEKDHPHGKDEH
ncbi:hypothetical protein LTR85_002675 [Meristemomyces frigidus]|nr:hypothetical protein LTR85_002675 [Meristemomyces frigidus]